MQTKQKINIKKNLTKTQIKALKNDMQRLKDRLYRYSNNDSLDKQIRIETKKILTAFDKLKKNISWVRLGGANG